MNVAPGDESTLCLRNKGWQKWRQADGKYLGKYLGCTMNEINGSEIADLEESGLKSTVNSALPLLWARVSSRVTRCPRHYSSWLWTQYTACWNGQFNITSSLILGVAAGYRGRPFLLMMRFCSSSRNPMICKSSPRCCSSLGRRRGCGSTYTRAQSLAFVAMRMLLQRLRGIFSADASIFPYSTWVCPCQSTDWSVKTCCLLSTNFPTR